MIKKGNNHSRWAVSKAALSGFTLQWAQSQSGLPLEFTQTNWRTSMSGSREYHSFPFHTDVTSSEALTLQQQQREGWSVQSCQEYLSSLGTGCEHINLSTSTRWLQALTVIKTYNHANNIMYSFRSNLGCCNWFDFFHDETIALFRLPFVCLRFKRAKQKRKNNGRNQLQLL